MKSFKLKLKRNKRGTVNLTNEPYVTGGNSVIAGDKTLFNDILGTTQGSTDGEKFASIERDAFGQVLDKDTDTDYDYFTGKPKVEGLGYAFLFRNYNAGLCKWTTSDPLGYPDGWNNFAYCNNRTTDCFDWLGGKEIFIKVEKKTPPSDDYWSDYWSDGGDGYEYNSKYRQKYKEATYSLYAIYDDTQWNAYSNALSVYNTELEEYKKKVAEDPNYSGPKPTIPNAPNPIGTKSVLNGSLVKDGDPIVIDTRKRKKE